MAREFAKSFYSSKAWQDCREAYAKKVCYLCEECLRKGIYRPGEIVHHKEQITPMNIYNPEIAFGFGNLELLCRSCHGEQHNARDKARRYSFDEDGKIFIKENPSEAPR